MRKQNTSAMIVLLVLIVLTAPLALAADRYSVASGNWNLTSTWSATSGGASGASVPGASDNVYIERGYTVTIAAAPTNGTIASLTIGGTTAGTLDIHPAASGSYTVTVSGDVIINTNGSFTVTNYSGYNYHTINIGGNLTVEGTFNMTTATDDHATVVFNGGAQQTITGAGTTCTFYSLTASNTSTTGLVLNRNIVLAVSGTQTATNLTVTANDIFDLGSYTCDRSTSGGGTVTVSAGATLKIGGTNTFPANYNTNTLDAASTVIYNGTTQTVRALTYGNLTISGSGIKTLAGTTSIVGNLTVAGGTFDLSSYTANRSAAGGTLTVSNGATLKIGGTNSFPSNYSTHALGSISTVEYSGTNQTVANESYGHLTLSGGGTKTMPGSTMTIAGNFSLSGTPTATAGAAITVNGDFDIGSGTTFNAGSYSHIVKGNWSVSGTFDAGTSTYTLNGSGAQTIAGATYNSITINNSNGVSLTGSATVGNTLTLTSGKVTLDSYNLTIGASGSISGASASNYIVTNSTGVLTRNSVGATDVLFPVGTSSTYNPATINNAGTSDNFSVRVQPTFDNAPPDPNKVVNRQWTITEGTAGGSNATITLQWNTVDEAAGFVRTDPIYIGRHTGTQWVQTAATFTDLGGGVYTASAGGFTSFSPFGVGNDSALPIQMASFSANVLRTNTAGQEVHADVEVSWKTVSETNNYGFEIERSRGRYSAVGSRYTNPESPSENPEWVKIGFVQGHGTTLTPQSYTYIDKGVPFGKYSYRIKQIDLDGSSEVFPEMEVTVGVTPGTFLLAQNYPNPFNPSTAIEFVVPRSGYTTLKVYNVLGQEVATLFEGTPEAGNILTVRFGASNLSAGQAGLPSGIYFYTLRSDGRSETKRMLLVK